MHRLLIPGIIFTLLITACVPLSKPQTQSQPTSAPLTSINVCYTAISGSQSILWYTFEKGFFKKYGLDAHMTRMNSASNAIPSMVAGENDFCLASGNTPVNAVASGLDVVVIAALYNIYPQVLMVSPSIQSAADLKGRLLGISDPGSTSENSLRIALRTLGIDADKDITMVNSGNEQERLLAMQAGRIDGTMILSPNTLLARQDGFHAMVDLGELKIPYLHTGVVSTRSYLAAHHDVGLNFMRALTEAIAAIRQDAPGAKEVLAKYFSLDVQKDAAILDELYNSFILHYMEKIPYPNLEGIQNLQKEVSAANPSVLKYKPEDLLDLSFLQELEKEGFFTRLYP